MPDEIVTVDDIDSAANTVSPSKSDTPVSFEEINAAFSRVAEERDALAADVEILKKKIRTTEILDDLIEPFAHKAFWFMCIYSSTVGLFLLLHGTKYKSFSLPDSVLNFLVGSTAVTVIGLVGMVLTGIFVGARSNIK